MQIENGNKKLKINNNDNDWENNKNNLNNNNNNSDKLWFSIWRNIYLRNQIIYHCRLFTKYFYVYVDSTKELIQHPYRAYIQHLDFYCSEPITSCGDTIIPDGVKTLFISYDFHQPLNPNDIPQSVTNLTIERVENNSYLLVEGSWPSSLTSLRLPDYNDDLNDMCLPSTLTSLDLDSFDLPIRSTMFPPQLKELCFRLYFNQPLDAESLPKSLIKLRFGTKFNQPILPFVLPNTLQKFQIDNCEYNQPLINDSIPNSVTDLILEFKKDLLEPGFIPNSVKHLELNSYNHPLDIGFIPPSVKTFASHLFNQPIALHSFPNSIETLELHSFTHSFKFIPPSVINLILGCSYFENINTIPSTVQHLQLIKFNQPLDSIEFPPTIKSLELNSFNQNITQGSLPPLLEVLNLGKYFDQTIEPNSIPPTCHTLILYKYDSKFKNSIPNKI